MLKISFPLLSSNIWCLLILSLLDIATTDRNCNVDVGGTNFEQITGRKIRRRRVKTSNKVRVVAGRVRLRVKGYEGLQTLAPSSLIRFIAATKLRIAARKVLRSSGVQPKRRRRASKKRKAIRRKR